MPITDPNSVATWVDLFLPVAESAEVTVYEQVDPTDPVRMIRASVHKWMKHADPGIDPTLSGDTIVSGTGGLKELQPISLNSFASFGGEHSKVDSGVLRFTTGLLGPVGTGLPAEYGVHFNTEPGDGNVGSNTGYALFYNSENAGILKRLVLARLQIVNDVFQRDDLLTLSDEQIQTELNIFLGIGSVIEVRWSQAPSVFGQANNIAIFINPEVNTNPIRTYDYGIDDALQKIGGLFGVCSWESGASASTSLITRFEYRNIIQPLSAYVDPLTGEAIVCLFELPVMEGRSCRQMAA